MNWEKVFSRIFVLVVVLGTLGYVWVKVPEQSSAKSADSQVTVSGVTRQAAPFSITKLDDVLLLPLFGSAYIIEPSTIQLTKPALLTFAVEGDKIPFEYQVVYRYDDSIDMWEEVLPIVSRTESTITVDAEQLGTFALGTEQNVQAPDFVSTYDELITKAPKNAVGYQTVVGSKIDGGAVVAIPGVGDSGGCGGLLGTGDGSATSKEERQAKVLVNDVLTTVTFVFETKWLTSSVQGCSPNNPLSRTK